MTNDEALMALEKKWRDAVEADRKQPMRMLENVYLCKGMESCADEIAALLTTRQEVAPHGDGTCYDRGPWRWKRTGSKVDVFSDDSTCDVALRIDGDFATDEVADSYAKWLADTLNGHNTSTGQTSDARDAVVTDAMVMAALDAQPLTDENESWRIWQIIGFDDARAKKIMRSALVAAMEASR